MHDMSDGADEAEYGLVMPFVNVASVGGKFDDEAFCAGYEMGKLDGRLAAAAVADATELRALYRSDNAAQADLIAMRHGFEVAEPLSGDHGWTNAILRRSLDG
jgi:hypothetical protein